MQQSPVLFCSLGKLCYLCLEFRHHSGGVWKDLTVKGVIEIIFISEILAKIHLE